MINLISKRLNQSANLVLFNLNGRNQIKNLFLIQSNNICHKNDLDPEVTKLRYPPFPYKEKNLNIFHKYFRLEGFMPTIGKFTENTKVVVVEGNIGSGKEAIAKKLADDLGMKFIPDVTPELEYKSDIDGFDWRNLNKHLHEDVWYPDFKTVLETKNPYQAAAWEMLLLKTRTYIYLTALTHLMNTGDGVVLERSPWSGTVFARTLNNLNLVGKEFLDHYWEVRSAACCTIFRPHIVIYLDVPVDKCLETAKRNNTHDCGHLLDEEYLELVEKNYKNHFLPVIEEHAEVFTYKLNEPVTEESAPELSELIVDELSKSNMDEYFMNVTKYQEKFEDWRFHDSDERLNHLRWFVTKKKKDVLTHFDYYPYYVDELWPAYNLLFARNFVTSNALEDRDIKLYNQRSFKEKYFGRKKSFDEKDSEEWLIKTGYPPDYIQADG